MKAAKNRKQRGSVLLTVVSVMSILIVFLFGTMALAVANNNRAHVNYSSAQTGITARAVAESAIDAIGDSEAYAEAVGELGAGDEPITVKVQLKGDGVGTLGHVQDIVISHAGTKQYYDVNDKQWHSRDLLKFTATVTMSGVESTSSVYVLKHKSEDEESSSGGGAGFVTVANAALVCQTNIVGGAYISLPDTNEAGKYVYRNSHVDRVLNRTGGNETGAGIVGFGEMVASDGGATNAFTLNNSGAIIEADLFVNNNMYVQNWSGFVFPSSKTGITVWGDLLFNQNAIDQVSYRYLGDKSADLPFTDVPYIYVDGEISGRSGVVKLGNGNQGGDPLQDFPLNIFCGTINCGDIENNGGMGKNSVIAGNLYCMDEGGNSSIKVKTVRNQLFDWTDSVIKKIKVEDKETYVKGEICSNGNLELGAMTDDLTVNGDVRVKGDLKISGSKKVIIKGNLVVGGYIVDADNAKITAIDPTKLEVTGKIYTDNLSVDPEDIVFDVSNQVGYYYVYTPEQNGSGKWVGPDGTTPLDDGMAFIDGEYQYINNATIEGELVPENASDIRLYYTLMQVKNNETGEWRSVRPTDIEVDFADGDYEGIPAPYAVEDLIHYEIPYLYSWDGFEQAQLAVESADIEDLKKAGPGGRPELNDDELKGFYIKTSIIRSTFGEVADEGSVDEGYYFTNHDGKVYQYKIDTEYVKVRNSTFKLRYSKAGVSYPSPDEYLEEINEKNGQIYPKYAERLVLLGLNEPGTTNYGADGKVVKTLQEVLNKVANPYADYYKSDGTEKKPDKVNALYEDASKNNYTDLDDVSFVDGKYHIGESCVIDIADKFNNTIVITPPETGLLVVVKNLQMQNDNAIIIDDINGKGYVYFYVEDSGLFEHIGNGISGAQIITQTYYNALFEKGYKKLSYNSGEIDGYVDVEDTANLGDGSPNVYIYGGKGSEMKIPNMGLITANIISPHLKLEVKGGVSTPIESFVYDGYDVVQGNYYDEGDIEEFPNTGDDVKYLILGCVNVEAANIPNRVNSIYIPSESGGSGGGHRKDANWWYKVLYYNEF